MLDAQLPLNVAGTSMKVCGGPRRRNREGGGAEGAAASPTLRAGGNAPNVD